LKLYLTADSTVTYWLFITFVAWRDIQRVLNLSRNRSSRVAVHRTNRRTFAPYFPIHGCPHNLPEQIT
jgi:hypothetical protein